MLQAVPVNFDGLRFSVGPVAETSVPENSGHEAHANAPLQQPSRPPPTIQPSPRFLEAQLHTVHPDTPADQLDHHEAQMSRMVDDLVGPDEESPRQRTTTAAGFGPLAAPFQPSRSPSSQHVQRLQSVSSLWGENHLAPRSPSLDHSSRPYGTPPSNNIRARAAHSRVGSSASVSSQSPFYNGVAASSFVPTPPLSHNVLHTSHMTSDGSDYAGMPGYASGMQSPLLFGAGGGPWSTRPRQSLSNQTPPNGQGG